MPTLTNLQHYLALTKQLNGYISRGIAAAGEVEKARSERDEVWDKLKEEEREFVRRREDYVSVSFKPAKKIKVAYRKIGPMKL